MSRALAALLVTSAFVFLGTAPAISAEVNVYSARKEALIKPMFDRFTAETGIEVNFITDSADELLARLESEGRNSPADLFLTVDVGRITNAEEKGFLRAIQSAVLEGNVPSNLRDPQGYWFGLSKRARVIFYNRDRVAPGELSTYEDLADPRWRGRICVRSSNNIYNQSLVASLIAVHGVQATEEWARGLVRNFARDPKGGDTDQIRAVAAGECDLAIANTYYYGRLMASSEPDDQEVVARVGIFFPDQNGRGAHVNISGGGVTKFAPHPLEAQKLLEFLSGDEAQAMYAERNHEFPVKPGVAGSALVDSWGSFEEDTRSLVVLGTYNAEAVRLMDRAGWK